VRVFFDELLLIIVIFDVFLVNFRSRFIVLGSMHQFMFYLLKQILGLSAMCVPVLLALFDLLVLDHWETVPRCLSFVFSTIVASVIVDLGVFDGLRHLMYLLSFYFFGLNDFFLETLSHVNRVLLNVLAAILKAGHVLSGGPKCLGSHSWWSINFIEFLHTHGFLKS
jgi:hypothetical protein